MRKNIKIHFQSVLIAGVLTAIFLHMIISDLMSARELQKEISTSVESDNQLIADALSDKLVEMFRKPSDELETLSNAIYGSEEISKGFDEGIRLTQHMRSFDRIILVDEKDTVFKVWPQNKYMLGIDQSGTGYSKILKQKSETFWSGTYVNYTNGEMSIDLIIPTGNSYLVGTIYLKELSNVVTSLKNKPGTVIGITDRNNAYIAHSDSIKVQQRVKDPYLLKNNGLKSAEVYRKVIVDGEVMRPFVKELIQYGWHIVIYYPVSLYEKPVWDIVINTLLLQLVSLSVIVIFLVSGSNYVNSLLKKILDFTHKIKNGNYEIETPKVFFSEFSEVIRGFEHMASEIQNRESQIIEKSEQIQQMNEVLEIRIKERTVDLELANQNLNHTMHSLIETQEQLVQQEKLSSLGNLVQGIAHEINTPLGIGITTSTFIEQEVDKTLYQVSKNTLTQRYLNEFLDLIKESVQILNTSLQQTAKLVDDFKETAVIEKSTVMSKVFMKDIVLEVFHELGEDIHQQKYKIEIDPIDFEFECFPEDLVLILFNLIRNSLVHGISELQEGYIQVEIKLEKEGALISVKDNGKGIPEEYLKQIFDPFFTSKRGVGEGSGRGLGLYIVYNLVTRRYKGSIKCESQLNQGSTFFVRIPICDNNLESQHY